MTFKEGTKTELSSTAVSNICETLKCEAADIENVEAIKVGLTNKSFSFMCRGSKYVYREPGKGTNEFINRESEAFSEELAYRLGIDRSLIKIDPKSGWKLSRFVEDYSYINPYDEADCALAMRTVKTLHESGAESPWNFDYTEQTELIESLSRFKENVDFSRYEDENKRFIELGRKLAGENHKTAVCHNDAWHWNMLKGPDGRITLIDWEYSGNSYPEADVAYFTASLDYSDEDYFRLAEIYDGRPLDADRKRFYLAVLAIVLWYWFVWALYKEALGTAVDDKDLWYKKAVHALDELENYQ